MNKRFESLMYHAGMTAQGCWDEMDSYQREAVEKFAQLIIAECCVALHPMLRDMISRTQAVDMIVTHFKDQ